MPANLAAVLSDVGTIVVESRSRPAPGPREVIVDVRSVGVCGSDVHYYREGRIGDFIVDAPLILGHEASGVVVERGTLVLDLAVGQRVAIEPGVPDGVCVQCLSGRYNLCPQVRFLATPPVDGAFVRQLAVPAAFAHPVPDHLSDDAAALIEPLSVAVAACRRAGVGIGTSVLITGAGPIGVLMSQVALAAGAGHVVLTDVQEPRRHRAGMLTRARVLSPDDVPQDLRVDVFIECSGARAAVTAGFTALSPGGRCVLVGMGADVIEIPAAALQTRELWITGAFRYANTYPAAIQLAASGAIDLDAMVDRHFSLADAETALQVAHADATVMKAVVRVQD